MSLMLLIIFPTVKQTWPCRDDVLPNGFYCSFLNTHHRKNINWCFELYLMCYSWCKILSAIYRKWSETDTCLNYPDSNWHFICLQHPYIRYILIGNTRYRFRDTYPLCSATGMLSGKLTMWKFKSWQVSFSTDPN